MYKKCFNFNLKGNCYKPSCQYMQKCKRCSGSHPQYQCPLSLSLTIYSRPHISRGHHCRDNPSLDPLCHIQHKPQGHRDIWTQGSYPIKTKKIGSIFTIISIQICLSLLKFGFSMSFEINYTGQGFHVNSKHLKSANENHYHLWI